MMAPPAIPVQRILQNEPWNLANTVKGQRKMMAYTTDKQNPSAGKPNKANIGIAQKGKLAI